ncbi:MAG: glycosyltransferase family 2 protein [archaeon]
MKKTISVVIPCYNEEKTVAGVSARAVSVLDRLFDDYEVLIFNDCSTDNTAAIADDLAKENPRIRVIHNRHNRGLGYNFREGVRQAKMDFFFWITGDDNHTDASIADLLGKAGKYDVVISYTPQDTRLWYRKVMSKSFTALLNLLFGQNLNYYCGISVFRTGMIKKCRMTTDSFAMQAEVLVQLLKAGPRCTQHPISDAGKDSRGLTSVFRISNVLGVAQTLISLFFYVHSEKYRRRFR